MEDYLSKCINPSMVPVDLGNHRVVYLYETTCIITGDIYIGVRVYKGLHPNLDLYIGNGCGVRKNGNLYKRRGKETTFRRALSKYGYINFKKKIICFFSSIEDALASEERIVDEAFLSRPDTLNMTVGGGFPPYFEGEANPNYGHRWTEEQKKRLSKKRKKNGKSKGSRNPKAKSCWVYDLWTGESKYYTYMREADFLNRFGCKKIRKYRYLISDRELHTPQEIESYILTECNSKYHGTYQMVRLWKQGCDFYDMVEQGVCRGQIGKFLKYVENSKNRKRDQAGVCSGIPA